MNDERLALFLMLGQTAERVVEQQPETAPSESLLVSEDFDLAPLLPREVKLASHASEVYRLFFVFENFLRGFVLDVLSEGGKTDWWAKVPKDVQQDIEDLEKTEEVKAWMALGTRDRVSLTTYNQLLKIVDDCWKAGFEQLVRDKYLIQEARHIAHLRNAACHMTDVPDEEVARVRQVIRDWFRVVSP
jgi:Swt1-like HEPN